MATKTFKNRGFTVGEDELSITTRAMTDAEKAAYDAKVCSGCNHSWSLHGDAGCTVDFYGRCACTHTH